MAISRVHTSAQLSLIQNQTGQLRITHKNETFPPHSFPFYACEGASHQHLHRGAIKSASWLHQECLSLSSVCLTPLIHHMFRVVVIPHFGHVQRFALGCLLFLPQAVFFSLFLIFLQSAPDLNFTFHHINRRSKRMTVMMLFY